MLVKITDLLRLLFFISVYSFITVSTLISQIHAATIKGTLWTLAEGVPHQTGIVVEAVSISSKAETVQITLSDAFDGSYIFQEVPMGRYYLRCHGLDEYIYYQDPRGMAVELAVDSAQMWTGIDFHFSPFKKGIWRNYTYLEHQLPGARVHGVYQMANGEIWCVTNGGSCRFDGQVFTKMPGVLGHINSIFQESDGKIWISTTDGVYQYQRNTLTRFLSDSQLADTGAIVRDIDGNLWIEVKGDDNGIFKYDGQELHHFTEQDGLVDNQIWDVFSDRQGNIWLTHDRSWSSSAGKGVTKFDGHKFVAITTADGLASNWVATVNQDSTDRLWFGTGKGLSIYQGGQFATYSVEDGLPGDEVHDIFFDQDEKAWLSTSGGVSRFDGKRFVNFSIDDGVVDNQVFQIYRDSNQTFWFGTRMGLSRYDLDHVISFTTADGLISNSTAYAYRDTSNKLLIGTNGGLTLYNGKQFLVHAVDDYLVNNAWDIYQDGVGTFWFFRMSYQKGLSHGVSKYDGKTVQHYTIENGLIGDNVSSICSTPDNAVWFGVTTRAGGPGGLSRYHNKQFTNFTVEDGLVHDAVRFLESDPWGRVWIGTGNGLSCYDGEQFFNFTTEDGLAGNDMKSMLVDSHNRLWLGTHSGVSVGDLLPGPPTLQLTHYTTQDGLSHSEVRGGIYEDQDGIIWCGTRAGGVCMFDGISWSALDKRDGIGSNEFALPSAITQDKEGDMWFAAGLTRYRRSEIEPAVEIASIQTAKRTYSRHEIAEMKSITAETQITIKYNAIDFITHPSKRQYRYRVRELQMLKEWSPANRQTNWNFVFNSAGTYTFEVQAINRDLRYSEPASISFKVVPIWYMNGWIIFPAGSAILVILVLAIVNGTRYYQQRRESERLELEAQQLQTRMLAQEREARLALESELLDAHNMQMNLLPKSAPSIAGLQIAGRNIAAKEVGGDFFDYLQGEGQLSVAVGDVSGKGLKGAMNAVMASGILRLASGENPTSDSSVLMSKVNKSLCQSMEQDMNVTMILAQFDLPQNQMTLVNAGQHAYPLLKRATSVEPVKAKGLALGMIPSVPYKARTLELQSGDLLLFMTDGITEPRNAEGLMYEESGRFHQVIAELSDDLTAEEVVESIIQDVIDYMVDEEERDDDITLVAVKVT